MLHGKRNKKLSSKVAAKSVIANLEDAAALVRTAARSPNVKRFGDNKAFIRTKSMLAQSSNRASDAVDWYRGFMKGLGLPRDPNVEHVIEQAAAAIDAAPTSYDSALASLQATLDAMPSPLDLIPGVRVQARLSDDVCGHCGHVYNHHVGTHCGTGGCRCTGFSGDHSGMQRA